MNNKTPKISKTQYAMKIINDQISIFVKRIVEEHSDNSDIISYKLEIKNSYYIVYLFNSFTKQMAAKAWNLNDFLTLCSNKKVEFELNKAVLEMLIKIDHKLKDEITWI